MSLFNIAHRGGSAGPENSLAAIANAVGLGVDAVEVDLWALHGELYVTHDRRLGHNLPGQGLLRDQSPEQLAALRLANGEPLPSLSQVYALTRGKCLLNVEIKGPDSAQSLCRWLVQQFRTGQAQPEDFLLSSFDQVQLLYCLERLPQVRRALLVEGIPLRLSELAERLGLWAFNPSLSFLNHDLVVAAHQAGLKVFVYTVNQPDDWQWLMSLGVDGVFTDYPEQLQQFLNGL